MPRIYIVTEGFYEDAIGAFSQRSDADAYAKLRNTTQGEDCHEYNVTELEVNPELCFAEMRQCAACMETHSTPPCPDLCSNPPKYCMDRAHEEALAANGAAREKEVVKKRHAKNGPVKTRLLGYVTAGLSSLAKRRGVK